MGPAGGGGGAKPPPLCHFQEGGGAEKAGEISGNRVTGNRVVSPSASRGVARGWGRWGHRHSPLASHLRNFPRCDFTLLTSEKFPLLPQRLNRSMSRSKVPSFPHALLKSSFPWSLTGPLRGARHNSHGIELSSVGTTAAARCRS